MRQIVLLISGCVKLIQLGQGGTEVILRLSGPGEIVGALGLCTNGEYFSAAQATEPCVALVWDVANFANISERFPAFRRNLVNVLEARLHDMDKRFRELSTERVAPRLSSELIRLSTQVGKQVNGHVEIALSRAELAQLTGTTLFTVSRLLCRWELQGIVCAQRECVLLRNMAALKDLAM